MAQGELSFIVRQALLWLPACCAIILALIHPLAAQQQPIVYFPGRQSDTVFLAYHDDSRHYDSTYRIPFVVLPAKATLKVLTFLNHKVTLGKNGRGSVLIKPQSAVTTQVIFQATYNGETIQWPLRLVTYINLEDIKPAGTWPARTATVGVRYNPSTNWYHQPRIEYHDYYIPWDRDPENFQTIVEFDARMVFDHAGAVFPDSMLPATLMVTDGVQRIRTTVYYRPGKTRNKRHWQLMVTQVATYSERMLKARQKANTFNSKPAGVTA